MELFSPNSLNMSTLGKQALGSLGVPLPDDKRFPTGQEYYDCYLQKISSYLDQEKNCEIFLRNEVVSVARAGMLKGDLSRSRKENKFEIFCETSTSTGEVCCKSF